MAEQSILFVDDEFAPEGIDTAHLLGSYMSYYSLALREAGYRVTCARGVDEAIQQSKDNAYDLAILDVMMPPGTALEGESTLEGGISGVLLARRLHDAAPKLAIVLLSNAAKNAERFSELLNDCIVKQVFFKLEVTPVELAEWVSENLSSGSIGQVD